eukprot:403335097
MTVWIEQCFIIASTPNHPPVITYTRCSLYILVTLMASVVAILMMTLLFIQLRRYSYSPRMILRVKSIIFILCTFISIDVSLHYTVLDEKLLIFSFIFLETCKFMTFFLVCFYFFINAIDLLPNKKVWGTLLKVFLGVGLVIEIIGLFFLVLYRSLFSQQSSKLCIDAVFLIIRLGGELVTFIFLMIGIAITRKVNSFQRSTTFEKTTQLMQQKRAIKKLWNSCDVLIKQFELNELLWFFSRTISNTLWMIPILIVFWPSHQICCCRRICKKQNKKRSKNSKLHKNRISLNPGGTTGDSFFYEESSSSSSNSSGKDDLISDLSDQSLDDFSTPKGGGKVKGFGNYVSNMFRISTAKRKVSEFGNNNNTLNFNNGHNTQSQDRSNKEPMNRVSDLSINSISSDFYK